ncbi:MAG TPA: hypothetical protein VFZ11_08850 [Gemmatimonadaceae bacterium]
MSARTLARKWLVALRRALPAIAILVAMPLGMLHRSTTGGCRLSAAAASGDVRATGDSSRVAAAADLRAGVALVAGHAHDQDHPDGIDAVPGGCGPALAPVAAAPGGVALVSTDAPDRRALLLDSGGPPPPVRPPRPS